MDLLLTLFLFSQTFGTSASLDLRQTTSLTPVWTSDGCYKDTASSRTLANNTFSNDTGMTVEACLAFCETYGSIFAGVEFGKQCFCDYAIQSPGTATNASECNMPSAEAPPPTCSSGTFVHRFWDYIGCFTDNTSARALPFLAPARDGDLNNAEEINYVNICDKYDFYYAGMEFGSECWCGNEIGPSGVPASEAECGMVCTGTPIPNEFCGGRDRLTVFRKNICDGMDVSNFFLVAVVGPTMYEKKRSGGPLTYNLVLDTEDDSNFVLTTAACGSGAGIEFTLNLVLTTEGQPSPSLGSLAVPLGESPVFAQDRAFAAIYCETYPVNTVHPLLAVNGHADQWAVCPNSTADGRLDVVFAPIANHPHYSLSECADIFIEIVMDLLLTLSLISQAFGALASLNFRQTTPPGQAWSSDGCYTSVSRVFFASVASLPDKFLDIWIRDTASSRTLAGATFSNETGMTVEACFAFCEVDSYVFAGVEFGKQCFCDYAIQSMGTATSADECTMPCTGDSSEICGGANRMNLYSNELPGPIVLGEFHGEYSDRLWKYFGCFTDNPSARALPFRAPSMDGFMTTAEEIGCVNSCDNFGFYYAGMEFGSECWCGNEIGPSGVVASVTECHTACAGSHTEFCGGRDRLTVLRKDICDGTDVSNFFLVAFVGPTPFERKRSSGLLSYNLVLETDDGINYILTTAACGSAAGVELNMANSVLTTESQPSSLGSFTVLLGESPAFAPDQPPAFIYCESFPFSTGEPLLAVNGHADQWAVCPNSTAGGRLDVVFAPTANHPHYTLSECADIFIQIVNSPEDC
ncbi:WSC-domain-containing protein [Auriscalpium vulgare]|uniref:WSC-domain-containing protein n=1 Tax=Auriscalpium vulgare TaxID=40419 RepID=A0ACB8R944_9AGAM|nr:WSC-domain-containing protein [Auriscalpium vulgare]